MIAIASTDCFEVKPTFLMANSWKDMLLRNNHPVDRRTRTQGIFLMAYLNKTSSAGCDTWKHKLDIMQTEQLSSTQFKEHSSIAL